MQSNIIQKNDKLSIDILFKYREANHVIPEIMTKFVNDMSYLKHVTKKLNKYKKPIKKTKTKGDESIKNKDIFINLNKLSEENFSEISNIIVTISVDRKDFLLTTILNIVQQENNKNIYVKLLKSLPKDISFFEKLVYGKIKEYLSDVNYLDISNLIQLSIFIGVSTSYNLFTDNSNEIIEYIWNKALQEYKFKIFNYLLTNSSKSIQLNYIEKIKNILPRKDIPRKEKFALMDLTDLLKKN